MLIDRIKLWPFAVLFAGLCALGVVVGAIFTGVGPVQMALVVVAPVIAHWIATRKLAAMGLPRNAGWKEYEEAMEKR